MRYPVILLSSLVFYMSQANATDNSRLHQTKNKLQQLTQQISVLKQTLNHAETKRSTLNTELANTAKKISDSVRRTRLIQQTLHEKQMKIQQTEQELSKLKQQLTQQQTLLIHHVRASYELGEYQPLKWLLNQDDPNKVSRLLTLYQYLIRYRQRVMDEIQLTEKNIKLNQQQLNTEFAALRQLQQELHKQQQTLTQDKQYHLVLIESLNKDIQNKTQTLSDFERDKKRLGELLKTLALQGMTSSKTPFRQARRKLRLPVTVSKQAIQKMNQGITLFAAEGTPVVAVHPGKVVFSDWLNGYGLLLILDHGDGFMTLYAHNQALFKEKGSMVLQGEHIATVGHTGNLKQTGLYFEVRHNGKAIAPLDWLA